MIEPRSTSEQQQLVPQERRPSQRPIQRHPLTAAEYSGGEEAATLTLWDFWNILRRRRAIAINTFLLVVVLGIVLTLITTPRFSSTARVLVEGKTQTLAISDTNNPLSNLFVPTTGHDVATQVEILRSPVVLDEVYKTTKIPPDSVSVEVKAVADTDLIDLTATSTSKRQAEAFAKAMPEVYLRKVKGERIGELKAALSFAKRRMEEQRQRLQKAEAAVAEFEQQKGSVRQGQGAQLMTEMGNAQAAVSQAQSDLSVARSKLAALENARSGVSNSLQTPVTTTNPEIANLKLQIAQLQDQRAKLLFRFKPSEDEVKEVDLQIQQLQRRLAQTPETITNTSRGPNPEAANLESQITAARVAVREAQAALSAAQAREGQIAPELAKLTPLERTSARLQRDVQLAQQGLDSLAQSTQDLMMREQAAEAKNNPVSVISTASPAEQISPRIARNIVMALVLGALLACGMALLQHSLDDHVNDEEEARSLLDIPVLGMLPLVVSEAAEAGEKTPFDPESSDRPALMLSRSEPRLMESFRMLRSNVYFALVNSPSRTILVTSTVPGEGKSTTASNLATSLALDGRRVILVDADMRRPSLDKFFGLPRQPGLSNILAGQSSWRDALQETKVPGLRLITSGALPPNPAELLGSLALDELIPELQQEADMVIFDTPPCPATADTQVISSKVDGVIYVMHLGKVRKAGLQHAFDLLHQANAHLLGVVFNKFEASAQHGYGYYYGYGYGQEGDDASKAKKRSRKDRSSPVADTANSSNGSLDKMSDDEYSEAETTDAEK
jgi:capsular exopolysaccharide synthesis family protein